MTIDVAGYVDFNWTYDSTQTCIPGYAKTVSEELSFEFGKPQRSVVNIVGGSVSMPFAIGGQAKLKAKVDGFQTTNYCLPTAPEPEPEAPDCRTVTGKLAALLTAEIPSKSHEELAPLGQGVLLTLVRKSKTSQSHSCLANRPTVTSLKDDKGVHIDTTPLPQGSLAVPLVNSTKFWALTPGGRISRRIKIGGGCETATAHSSRLDSSIKRCTIGGTVVVVVKRLK